MNPALRKRLGVALMALSLGLPAMAQDTSSERIERRRVEPAETVVRAAECPAGTQVSGGGYQLYGQPEDRADFVVTGNYPLGDSRWRVEVRNITDRILPLTFRIYIICL